VLISPFMRDDLDADVGDRIELGTFDASVELGPGAEPVPGPTATLEVVGIATLPYDAADDSLGLIIATPAFFEEYAVDAAGFGPSLDVTVADGAEAEAVAEEVTAPFEFDELFFSPAADLVATVDDATRALVLGLWAFTAVAAVAFLVACAQAVRRRLEITADDQPALRALGLGTAERAVAATLIVAPIVVTGGALAAILAIPASATMPIGAPGRAEPDPGIQLDVTALVGGAALLALALLATTLWAARQVARQCGVARGGRGSALIARATPAQALRARLRPAEHFGVTMALDPDSHRGRVPVRSAFLGAMAGTAGLVGVLTFGAGLDTLVDDPTRSGWNWTLRIDAEEGDLDAVASVEGVTDLGRLVQRQVVVDGEPVQGSSMSSVKGAPAFTIVRGRMPTTDEEVVVGPELADRADVAVGDRVRMTTAAGDDVNLVVVGEALFPTFDDDVSFNNGAGLTATALDELAHSDGEGTTVATFADGISPEEAAHRVASVSPDAISIYSYATLPTEVANLDDVRPLPRALAVFLALLGLAAVGHALTTSVHRRRRELGTVRSLGFRGGQVGRAVAVQSETMIVGGLLVGIPLGVVVGRTVWRAVAESLGVVSSPTVPVTLLAVLVPAALVAGFIIALYPAWVAQRGVALDALRAE
jgi:hypothetical protein